MFGLGITVGGVRCSYVTWLSRGWCRAELWCRLLSIRKDPSVIVLFSAREAEFMFPIAWQDQMGISGPVRGMPSLSHRPPPALLGYPGIGGKTNERLASK